AQAGSRCTTPVQPPLGGSCSGRTTPEAAAECVGGADDLLADDMLPRAPLCELPTSPPPPTPLAPVPCATDFMIILPAEQARGRRCTVRPHDHDAVCSPDPAGECRSL